MMEDVAVPILVLFLFFLVGLWLYCFIDILTSTFRGNEKLLWVVVIILAPGIGMFLYLILGKRSKLSRRKFQPYEKRDF